MGRGRTLAEFFLLSLMLAYFLITARDTTVKITMAYIRFPRYLTMIRTINHTTPFIQRLMRLTPIGHITIIRSIMRATPTTNVQGSTPTTP